MSRDQRERRLDSFLTGRCSKEFLAAYVEDGSALERVSNPGLLLSASSEVDLAVRLHELGVLPENVRQKFVAAVSAYTFGGDDLHAVESKSIQSVFTEAELSHFKRRLRTELVPNLGRIRGDWEDWYESGQNPDNHMQPLLESMNSLVKQLADEPVLAHDIEDEISRAEERVAERMAEYAPGPERAPRTFGEVDTAEEPRPRRSVF
jgi:hypothetical protein